MFKVPEKNRHTEGAMASDSNYKNNGVFYIYEKGIRFQIIASDGNGWDHVSIVAYIRVTKKRRIPTWKEMCYIKDIFWDEEDCVVQFHPPKSNYVNQCEFALHLWKKQEFEFPLPKDWMV